MEYLVKWLDRTNREAIVTAREDTMIVKHDLITGASKNIGLIQQRESRRSERPYFSPRKAQ